MKDKETQNNVFDILDKIEFFQGQRAGRELWNDKPKEMQDKDISDFVRDINYIRSYLQDSVVLSREEALAWRLPNITIIPNFTSVRNNQLADLKNKSVIVVARLVKVKNIRKLLSMWKNIYLLMV